MASIKKIEGKNGVSYKITVSCGYDVKGKKIIETATFKPDAGLTPKKMEKAAQDFAHEFESRVKSGAAMDGRKVTLQVFADGGLKNMRSRSYSRGRSESIVKSWTTKSCLQSATISCRRSSPTR